MQSHREPGNLEWGDRVPYRRAVATDETSLDSPERQGDVWATKARRGPPRKSGARQVTMRDVADTAGVSVSAVSYVLNGSRPVRAERRERIRRAMEELGYVPNAVARALRHSRSQLLAALLPDLTNPVYGLMAHSIEAVARDAGYLIVIGTTSLDAGREDTYVRALAASRAEGIIVRPTRTDQPLAPAILDIRAPVVLLMHGLVPPSYPIDAVAIDNALGVRRAVQHLVEQGHERIALATVPYPAAPGRGRLDGFRAGMGAAGLPVYDELVHTAAPSPAAGQALVDLLLALDQPPTALIVSHHRQAVGVLQAVAARGIRVPDDLSLVVFGQPQFFAPMPVELTIVAQPFQQVGTVAAELLLRRIANAQPALPPQRLVLDPVLLPGGSVAAPRADARLARSPA